MGYEVLYLGCMAVFYTSLAIGLDVMLSYPKLATLVLKDPKCVDKPYAEDDDVLAEAERVRSGCLFFLFSDWVVFSFFFLMGWSFISLF